jgi:predicted dehydrogenase
MRFALLGNHLDGLEMACALIESGRHQLVAFSAPLPEQFQARVGAEPRLVPDLEELLADPAIELVIVAGNPANRGAQLRRALQAERHVVCVHPPESTPEIAYEANMIREDTHKLLFPLLPDALHPGVQQLAELVRNRDGAIGKVTLLHLEIHATGAALLAGTLPRKPCFPGWDVLRFVGGEIAEVSGLAPAETVAVDRQVLVHGRFVSNLLFQASFFPDQPKSLWRLSAQGDRGRAELVFALGKPGPAHLSCWDNNGVLHESAWPGWDPWSALVVVLDGLLAQRTDRAPSLPAWQDVVRALELDDAVRRSVEKRRATVMEYPDATEEAGFKGTMTLVGCGMLWLLLVVLILANWYPQLVWLIVALLAIFLGLQVLRWVLPGKVKSVQLAPPAAEKQDRSL